MISRKRIIPNNGFRINSAYLSHFPTCQNVKYHPPRTNPQWAYRSNDLRVFSGNPADLFSDYNSVPAVGGGRHIVEGGAGLDGRDVFSINATCLFFLYFASTFPFVEVELRIERLLPFVL